MSPQTSPGGLFNPLAVIPKHGHRTASDGGRLTLEAFGNVNPLSVPVKAVGQTAAISTTKLLVGPTPGPYRLSAYVEVTAKTANGTVFVTFGWTDAVGATTDASVTLAVTGTGRFYGHIPIEVATGDVTYAVGVGTFTGTYNLRVVAERLQ